jgi:monoamine oxidase
MDYSRLTDKEMLSVIHNGLKRTASPKRIIVAGAGMAGLVSASLLQEAGHDVHMIESSQRVGGRVFTIREPFTHGNHLEAGAMRFPETHKLVFAYIKKFKLPTQEFFNSQPHDFIYVNGIMTNQSTYENNPDILGFPVETNEKGKTAEQLMKYSLQPLIDFIQQDPNKNWPTVIKKFQGYSLDTFLRNNPFGRSLSSGAMDMIKVLLSLEGLPELSFLDVFRDILIIFINPKLKYQEIIGGNDQLPKAFLPQLKDHIFFSQKLTQIEQSPSKVTLYTESTVTSHPYMFEADKVIITIPFSVLNFIRIEPYHSLSYSKRKGIRELHYVPSTKIGIEFKSRFWEKNGLTGGKSVTDLPSRFSHYPNRQRSESSSGVVLGSYTWEDDTVPWRSFSNETRVRETLHYLSLFHGQQVYEQFVTGHAHSWSLDPHTGGAFTMFKPYQEEEIYEAIKAPEGRLHFAGEHTTLKHGWVEGAIESGIRAAMEVNES